MYVHTQLRDELSVTIRPTNRNKDCVMTIRRNGEVQQSLTRTCEALVQLQRVVNTAIQQIAEQNGPESMDEMIEIDEESNAT